MKARKHRFQLIKKVIESKQNEISARLTELKVQMDKKQSSISSFELYLNGYQEKLISSKALDLPSFINYQLFIDQIVKVLNKEREEFKKLTEKSQELKTELMKNLNQVEVIGEYIKELE